MQAWPSPTAALATSTLLSCSGYVRDRGCYDRIDTAPLSEPYVLKNPINPIKGQCAVLPLCAALLVSSTSERALRHSPCPAKMSSPE